MTEKYEDFIDHIDRNAISEHRKVAAYISKDDAMQEARIAVLVWFKNGGPSRVIKGVDILVYVGKRARWGIHDALRRADHNRRVDDHPVCRHTIFDDAEAEYTGGSEPADKNVHMLDENVTAFDIAKQQLTELSYQRVLLKFKYGMNIKEIANTFGVTSSAVSCSITESIGKLRTHTRELYYE